MRKAASLHPSLHHPVHGKTAHRPLESTLYPLPWQPAQEREPRGTDHGPLSAARFPA